MPRLTGRVRDDTGNAVANATVNAYTRGTTTPVVATDTTDANGDWALGPNESGDAQFTAAEDRGAYDVEIRNSTDRVWWNVNDEIQVKTVQINNGDADEFALQVDRTEDAASVEVAIFEGDRATMADNDEAYVSYRLSDDGGNQTELVRFTWVALDVTDTTEDGQLDIGVMTAGTLADELSLTGAALFPSTNDGLALGTTSLGWADLHGATGFTLNVANGNWLATHTSGILTVGTGDLRVTTAGTNSASVVTVGGTQTLTGKSIVASQITAGTFTAGTYSAAGSTFSDLGIVTTVDINGGTIDATTIGAASVAAGNFSTVTANSILLNAAGNLGFNGTIATAGEIRLAQNQSIQGRNNANSANVALLGWGTASADVLTFAAASTTSSFPGNIVASSGIRIGADSGDNEIDDATQGSASTTLYIGNASINVTSDARVKSNIRPWESPSIIDQLEVVEFDQHSNRPFGDVEHYVGLTAQNIYRVAPWAVNTQGGKDCQACLSAADCATHLPWQVNYGLLVGVLVKEIQALRRAA